MKLEICQWYNNVDCDMAGLRSRADVDVGVALWNHGYFAREEKGCVKSEWVSCASLKHKRLASRTRVDLDYF